MSAARRKAAPSASPTQYASVEDWAWDLPSNYINCRDLSHQWGDYMASYNSESRTYDRTLRCTSCGTEKVQVLDAYGEILRSSYRYSPGYLAANLIITKGRNTPKSTFRIVGLRRMTGGAVPTPIKKKPLRGVKS